MGSKRKRAVATEASGVDQAVHWAANDKPFDLFWLGRRPVREILADEAHELAASRPAIEHIMEKHNEASEIADGDQWQHGFNAGVVAFARLVGELSRAGGPSERARAWEAFPRLDS